ncbi:hypothetical protein L7F22_007764 [Adiantum nelumboides]|nr:hypothetical protein [Adiantum nelumboides]
MHAMGWNRTSTPASGSEIGNNAGPSGGQGLGHSTELNSRYPQSTPSRDKGGASLGGARAVLNKRMEEQRNYSPSPNRNQRPSPRDLFYWLEQAHDTENLGAATPGGNSDEADADLTAMDATPPSPSLLASTNSRFLLSRRRLKLIGRMFQQICEAVGFCHDRGISHRDIKPENFIVEDTRGSDFCQQSREERRWFGCKSDQAFRGLKHEAAQFLAEKVFCDVTEGEEESERRHRISAREFGDWASNLADHLESQESKQGMKIDHSTTNFLSPNMDTISAGADLGITSPLWHSRSPTSSLVNSLMASPASNPKSINIYQELANMGISEEEIDNFHPFIYRLDHYVREPTEGIFNDDRDELGTNSRTMGSAPSSSEHRSSDNEDRNVNGLSVESPTSTEAKEFEENDHSTIETSVENENGVKKKKREIEVTDESAENLHTEENSNLRPTESARDQIIRELAEASQSLAREMSKAIHNRDEAANTILLLSVQRIMSSRGIPINASKHTISSQTAMELKELQNRLAIPETDAATTTVSSLNSVSRGSTTSRASSHFTNFGWGDSRRAGSNVTSDSNTNRQDDSLYPTMNQSNVSLMMKNKVQGTQNGSFPRHVLQDSGRGRTVHPPHQRQIGENGIHQMQVWQVSAVSIPSIHIHLTLEAFTVLLPLLLR